MQDLQNELNNKNRIELNIFAKRLDLARYHSLNKSEIIDILLTQDEIDVKICLRTRGILKL